MPDKLAFSPSGAGYAGVLKDACGGDGSRAIGADGLEELKLKATRR